VTGDRSATSSAPQGGSDVWARRVPRTSGPTVLPAAWTGALPVSAADTATQRLTGSALLPVGVITGVAGGACLAWPLRAERRADRL
jgi:ABC-type enterobactin transport system permease subunit